MSPNHPKLLHLQTHRPTRVQENKEPDKLWFRCMAYSSTLNLLLFTASTRRKNSNAEGNTTFVGPGQSSPPQNTHGMSQRIKISPTSELLTGGFHDIPSSKQMRNQDSRDTNVSHTVRSRVCVVVSFSASPATQGRHKCTSSKPATWLQNCRSVPTHLSFLQIPAAHLAEDLQASHPPFPQPAHTPPSLPLIKHSWHFLRLRRAHMPHTPNSL